MIRYQDENVTRAGMKCLSTYLKCLRVQKLYRCLTMQELRSMLELTRGLGNRTRGGQVTSLWSALKVSLEVKVEDTESGRGACPERQNRGWGGTGSGWNSGGRGCPGQHYILSSTWCFSNTIPRSWALVGLVGQVSNPLVIGGCYWICTINKTDEQLQYSRIHCVYIFVKKNWGNQQLYQAFTFTLSRELR